MEKNNKISNNALLLWSNCYDAISILCSDDAIDGRNNEVILDGKGVGLFCNSSKLSVIVIIFDVS